MIEFVQSKVIQWGKYIDPLVEAADTQPLAAFAALSHSLQFEWSFLACVVPDCYSLFEPLKASINVIFWPALFGTEVSDVEKSLFLSSS